MPKPPRPLAAPTFALALILAIAPLTLSPPAPAAAAIVSAYASASREPLAPGVQYDQGRLLTSAGSQAVNIVEVDLANPAISLESSLSNGRVTGLERTSSQAQNHSVEGHRMSRRDTHHQEVVHALQKDKWVVTADPLTLDFAGKLVGIDLAAEKLLAAEREERRIAVEIKSFQGSSDVSEFHTAG